MGYFIFIILFILIIFYIYNYLCVNYFKPLKNLYRALEVIDFDDTRIDLTFVDNLPITGSKEVQFIIKKFKYLMDVITERVDRVNSEIDKSEHDELTGCYNRVKLQSQKGYYYNNEICVIFIDVNNLKKMNDIFGHEAGDNLLKTASNKLRFWESYGDVYRLGGDEFMIVTVGKSLEEVNSLVDKWYPTVGQLNNVNDSFKCLLSYGVSFGSKYSDFDDIQKDADEKMYNMKVSIKKKLGESMR